MRRRAWRNGMAALLLALIPGSAPTVAQRPRLGPSAVGWQPPISLFDPRLEAERKASVGWEWRTGPVRRVVDQVCLVPDLATFLEALATWDEGHYFPILIEDGLDAPRFLRAFRPARVVRYPGKAPPIPADRAWERAVAAVGLGWVAGADGPPGDAPPRRLGRTPPGIVVSSPESPMLAAAAALAAGRYQPLLRWDTARRFADLPSKDEALALVGDLEARIDACVPNDARLGDDVDFITLAGDYPYRYRTPIGINAFDDLIGRRATSPGRKAYAGRLIGSPSASVYRAMCSLFLQPESALLFNAYDEAAPTWSDYSMRPAADRLSHLLPVSHRSGAAEAGIDGWHEAFDPINRFGLVLINSSGSPTRFQLNGEAGQAGDVPPSLPTVVLQIHSFSAEDPTGLDTLAGRWLAAGAFVYFGSVYEPYLQSFRPPGLVGSLIADRLPLSAALRQSPGEPFGDPWRLVYLGDPLYRLGRPGQREPRIAWEAVADWPDLGEGPPPSADARDEAKLEWAFHHAVSEARLGRRPPRGRLAEVLRSIRRERLGPEPLRLYDQLLADLLDHAEDPAALRRELDRIPAEALSPELRVHLETSRVAELHRALAGDDLAWACRVWDELIRSDASFELKSLVTGRVALRAGTPDRLRTWRGQLRSTLRDVRATSASEPVEVELRRVEALLGL